MADIDGSAVRQRRKPPDSTATTAVDKTATPKELAPRPLELAQLLVPFCILFASHIFAALYHPIQDCDEVFNYWEPTHYLTHGYGFETWEYSPAYAIRSWVYAGLHAIFVLHAKVLHLVGVQNKSIEFYLTRVILGFICAVCETTLFGSIAVSKVAAILNPRVALLFLLIMATSPGMFHASISYLPSSFTMYTTMPGLAGFMAWPSNTRTAKGLFWVGAGAILGWPFAAAMAIPFLLDEVVTAATSQTTDMFARIGRVLGDTSPVLYIAGLTIGIDSLLYKKPIVIVPFNIVWYNIFSSKGGPDLYGTEPWHFYLRNLFLNFHVWLVLALLSLPLVLVQRYDAEKRASHLRNITFLSSFYLWLAIFTLQPHKEERLMYPAYPALALNAAVALHVILGYISSEEPKTMMSKIPTRLRAFKFIGFLVTALTLSAFRTIGHMTAFNAPLSVYTPLHSSVTANSTQNICLGKEWYRFPSHFFLPDTMRAKFINSEFAGLLPGEFLDATSEQGWQGLLDGIAAEPSAMNDQNLEDLSKYTELKDCAFLVDLHLPSTVPTKLEPNFIGDTEHWEEVKCLPFLDAASTGVLGRLGWVPGWSFIPQEYRRVFGDYCLLKRKRQQQSTGMRYDAAPHIETLG